MAVDPKRVEHTSSETRVVFTKGWKARRMGTQHSKKTRSEEEFILHF